MSAFYKLRHEKISKLMKKLSGNESIIYFYINARIPFGGKLNMSARKLAQELSLSPNTVSRAIKRLDSLGYIKFGFDQIEVERGIEVPHELTFPECANLTQDCANLTQSSPQKCANLTQDCANLTQGVSNLHTQALKPLLSAGSGGHRSNIENIDQSSSRSIEAIAIKKDDDDEEKLIEESGSGDDGGLISESGEPQEDYRSWLEERAATLPTPPTYLSAWVLSEAKKLHNQEHYKKLHRGSGRGLKALTDHLGGPALETFPAVPPNTSKLPPNNEEPMPQRPILRVIPGGQAPAIAPHEHLARMITKWKIQTAPLQRKQIVEQIASNPDWGLVCTIESGPSLAPVHGDSGADEEVAF